MLLNYPTILSVLDASLHELFHVMFNITTSDRESSFTNFVLVPPRRAGRHICSAWVFDSAIIIVTTGNVCVTLNRRKPQLEGLDSTQPDADAIYFDVVSKSDTRTAKSNSSNSSEATGAY